MRKALASIGFRSDSSEHDDVITFFALRRAGDRCEQLIGHYDQLAPEQKAALRHLAPYARICFDPTAARRRLLIKTVSDAQRLLVRGDHHNLIKLEKKPFKDRLQSVEDWKRYGLSDVYFLVHTIWIGDRWLQTIRHVDIEGANDRFNIADDMDDAIDTSRRIARCPNCCPDGRAFPEASVAVPTVEIARYFRDRGWDEDIVDEIILWHENRQPDIFN